MLSTFTFCESCFVEPFHNILKFTKGSRKVRNNCRSTSSPPRSGWKRIVFMALQVVSSAPVVIQSEVKKESGAKTLHDLSKELKQCKLDAGAIRDFEVKVEDRPTVSYDEWADLPVIDLSKLETDRAGVCKDLGEAAKEWGFFQIVNHGMSVETLKEIEAQGFKFFELPAEDKLKLGRGGGYSGNNTESKGSALHWAESWMVSYAPRSDIEEKLAYIFPKGDPGIRDALYNFSTASEIINKQILELLAEYLGLETRFFSQYLNERRSLALRWNYYPACPKPFDVLGANGHTDGSSLTVLQQDTVGGLQIHRNGQWFGVKPIEGALVVNVGDALYAWTNGHLKSVLHRVVVNRDVRRLSLAAFCNVDNSLFIKAPKELVDEEHPRLYQPFTFGDYIQQILRARMGSSDPAKVMNGLHVLEALRIQK
ncbi:hypothetical protein Mapa_014598 [Marchantia paleacea]|nr:hypothetical protein Mapa_014598 [Marchantia paleacea]